MEEPTFVVRRAQPDDATAMADVHARSWRSTYPGLVPAAVIDAIVGDRSARIDRWGTWLAKPARDGDSFVADIDDRVVGFVFWGPSEGADAISSVAQVYSIYLDPDAIGKGIGRSLFSTAVNDIAAHGYAAAILWVLDTNARARRFYEAAGWRSDGATKTEHRAGGDLREVRYGRTFVTE